MMFNFAESFKAKLERLVNVNAASKLTDEQFIVKEIQRFKQSQRRKEMLDEVVTFINSENLKIYKDDGVKEAEKTKSKE